MYTQSSFPITSYPSGTGPVIVHQPPVQNNANDLMNLINQLGNNDTQEPQYKGKLDIAFMANGQFEMSSGNDEMNGMKKYKNNGNGNKGKGKMSNGNGKINNSDPFNYQRKKDKFSKQFDDFPKWKHGNRRRNSDEWKEYKDRNDYDDYDSEEDEYYNDYEKKYNNKPHDFHIKGSKRIDIQNGNIEDVINGIMNLGNGISNGTHNSNGTNGNSVMVIPANQTQLMKQQPLGTQQVITPSQIITIPPNYAAMPISSNGTNVPLSSNNVIASNGLVMKHNGNNSMNNVHILPDGRKVLILPDVKTDPRVQWTTKSNVKSLEMCEANAAVDPRYDRFKYNKVTSDCQLGSGGGIVIVDNNVVNGYIYHPNDQYQMNAQQQAQLLQQHIQNQQAQVPQQVQHLQQQIPMNKNGMVLQQQSNGGVPAHVISIGPGGIPTHITNGPPAHITNVPPTHISNYPTNGTKVMPTIQQIQQMLAASKRQ